jgi:hypothetical protein
VYVQRMYVTCTGVRYALIPQQVIQKSRSRVLANPKCEEKTDLQFERNERFLADFARLT